MRHATLATALLILCLNAGAAPAAGPSQPSVDGLLAGMTLRQKVAQMFMVDLRTQKTREEKLAAARGWAAAFPPGGIILFADDMKSTDDVVDLTHAIQKAAGIPLFVGVDQEGGRVTRLSGGTNMPGNMALAATGSGALAREAARILGREIGILGINLNFAPDLDVNVNPENPVIGVRSFGENPRAVADFGLAYARGLRDAGVMATGKHFPGHGDTSEDSHLELPTIAHGRKRVRAVELVPFRAAIAAGIDMIMTAHVTFPSLDPTLVPSKKTGQPIHLPATLSEPILTGLLRKELGYRGVVVTDAFNMKAIADNFGEIEATLRAIRAGADIILMPTSLDEAVGAVCDAVAAGAIPERRIDESARRILALKAKYGLLAYAETDAGAEARKARARALVNSRPHREIERYIAERAVTWVRGDRGVLPFPVAGGRHLLLAPNEKLRAMMHEAASGILRPGASLASFRYDDDAAWPRILERLASSDHVVVGTLDLAATPDKAKATAKVLALLEHPGPANGKRVALAIKSPYDPRFLPAGTPCLAVYGSDKGPNVAAGMRAIYGGFEIRGKLPVTVPEGEDTRGLRPLPPPLEGRGPSRPPDSPASVPAVFPVRLGVDNLDAHLALFKGKRVGLVTNQSGINAELKSTIDVLHGKVRLTALFAPEHGIRGVAQAGDHVKDEVDRKTGLKVYSLHGDTKKPTPEMLRDVDLLVYDMQDVGARFYTYINTMALCMEACAEQGKTFVVLDRPNPLSGLVQGNLLDLEHKSFVGMYPIPQRYGMTIGEFAGYVNKTAGLHADLAVVPMAGWRREMHFDETGLKTWVPPSPNMPTIDTALVYPGTCLFEGTNVSEGRGTTRPFEQIGAPWIDGLRLADKLNALNLPGVKFRAASFTPSFSKHQGEPCQGVQVHVTDRRAFHPVKCGLAMLATVRDMRPDKFRYLETNFIDKLFGDSRLREGRASLAELFRRIDRDAERFRGATREFLLYR